MSDDAEYDDDYLRCCRRSRAAACPSQCFAWAEEDATLDSARCLASRVVTELAVNWALEVERFAADQAEPTGPD